MFVGANDGNVWHEHPVPLVARHVLEFSASPLVDDLLPLGLTVVEILLALVRVNLRQDVNEVLKPKRGHYYFQANTGLVICLKFSVSLTHKLVVGVRDFQLKVADERRQVHTDSRKLRFFRDRTETIYQSLNARHLCAKTSK